MREIKNKENLEDVWYSKEYFDYLGSASILMDINNGEILSIISLPDFNLNKRTTIKDLNLAQWAMIAGLPKAPSSMNPLVNPRRALIRRNWILTRMLDLGYIYQEQQWQKPNSTLLALNLMNRTVIA